MNYRNVETKSVKININDIHITNSFKNTTPNQRKIDSCMEYYLESGGRFDRDIIVDPNNVLRDGYVMYLVAEEMGETEILVKQIVRKTPVCTSEESVVEHTYIYGKHPNNDKEYIWWVKNKIADTIQIGDRVKVNTKHGDKIVEVTKVVKTNVAPTESQIKSAFYIVSHKNEPFEKVKNALNDLDISVKKANGEFKNTAEVMSDLRSKWVKEKTQNQWLIQVGGVN